MFLAGSPWYKVKKVSREEYREILERREALELGEPTEPKEQAPSTTEQVQQKKSPKERIDGGW